MSMHGYKVFASIVLMAGISMAAEKKVALIVASQGFQTKEYSHTKNALAKEHIAVETFSDKVYAVSHDEHLRVEAKELEHLNSGEFDGMFLIGGPGALKQLDTPSVYKLIKKFVESGKPWGAICISPRILANAQVLKGRKATGWDGDGQLAQVFKKHGVIYVTAHVVVDGELVTADGPEAATEFGQKIAALVQEHR